MIVSTPEIVLEVHICDQQRSYKATFATDQQAAEFMERKGAYCAFHELEEGSVRAEDAPLTYAKLWPTCEHGMSSWLCSGPNHFGERGDDWAY